MKSIHFAMTYEIGHRCHFLESKRFISYDVSLFSVYLNYCFDYPFWFELTYIFFYSFDPAYQRVLLLLKALNSISHYKLLRLLFTGVIIVRGAIDMPSIVFIPIYFNGRFKLTNKFRVLFKFNVIKHTSFVLFYRFKKKTNKWYQKEGKKTKEEDRSLYIKYLYGNLQKYEFSCSAFYFHSLFCTRLHCTCMCFDVFMKCLKRVNQLNEKKLKQNCALKCNCIIMDKWFRFIVG